MANRHEILTVTGNSFNILDPEDSSYGIEEIAHGLAHTCRFCGQCRQFYSVAQHSVLVSLAVPSEDALAGLLHDASEAFLGDITSPLKQLLPDYRMIEHKVETAILQRFGVNCMPPTVKPADLRLLVTEQRDLMPPRDGTGALARVVPLPQPIVPLEPAVAKQLFLKRFDELACRTGPA